MIKECIHKQDPAGTSFCQQKKKNVKEEGEWKGNRVGKDKISVLLKSARKILVKEAKLNKFVKILV